MSHSGEAGKLDLGTIRNRIENSRKVYRDSILSGLISESKTSEDGDEAELRRLQDLDERLRNENIELELLKQQIAKNLRDSKIDELSKITQETEQELESFERERERMLMDMERKKSEIEVLQRDLRHAESRLNPREGSPANSPSRQALMISRTDHDRQIVQMAEARATNAARRSLNREYLLSDLQEIDQRHRVPSRLGADVSSQLTADKNNSRTELLPMPGEPEGLQTGEALDRLLEEAERILRTKAGDNQDILRRLDKLRGTPRPDSSAPAVTSSSAGQDGQKRIDQHGGPNILSVTPTLHLGAQYVPTKDTLDKWLSETSPEPGTKAEASASLHFNRWRRAPSSSPRDQNMIRSQSAAADLPSNAREKRFIDGLGSLGADSGHQTDGASRSSRTPAPKEQSQSRPLREPSSPRQFQKRPEDESPSHFPVDDIRRKTYQRQHQPRGPAMNSYEHPRVPYHPEMPSMQYYQQDGYHAPYGFYGNPMPFPRGEPVPYAPITNPFPPTQQYDPGRFARDRNAIPYSYLHPEAHPADQHQKKLKQKRNSTYRKQLSDDEDESGDDGRGGQTKRVSYTNEDTAEVTAMKQRMKELAEELENENRKLEFQVSSAQGTLTKAVREGEFNGQSDSTPNLKGQGPWGTIGPPSAGKEVIEGNRSDIMIGKQRVDEILSKQVQVALPIVDSSVKSRRASQYRNPELEKEKTKYEAELEKMRMEMDILRQKAALDELKQELEAQRLQRSAEKEHEDWLRERKHKLQAIRVQKALYVEQKLYEDDLAALGIKQTDEGMENKKATLPQNEKIDDLPMTVEEKGKFELIIDGLLIPSSHMLEGNSMRVVCGFVSAADGSLIGRLAATEWQPSSKAVQRGKSFKRMQSELSKLNVDTAAGDPSYAMRVSAMANLVLISLSPLVRRPTSQETELLGQPLKSQRNSEESSPCSQLRVMIEVQVRDNAQGVAKGAGWCTFDPSDHSEGLTRVPRYGTWRIELRQGIADPKITSLQRKYGVQMEENLELSASNDMWLLCRIKLAGTSVINGQSSPAQMLLEGIDKELAVYGAFKEYQRYDFQPAPAKSNIVRSDSVKVAQIQSTQMPSTPTPASLGRGAEVSTTSGKHTPLSSEVRPASSNINIRSSSQKLSAGLDVLSAIHEMKELYEEHKGSSSSDASSYFCLGTSAGSASHKYTKGDGIDVYVDGARFLPANATVSRCVAKMFSLDGEQIPLHKGAQVVCGYSKIDASATSPSFNLKVECRASVFNCSCTILIRIDTIDASTLTCCGVGYAAVKLFCSKDRNIIIIPNDPAAYVNTGGFQVPLYGGRVSMGSKFDENTLSECMTRIPCCSVLIRVEVAPKSSDGLATLSCMDVPEVEWKSLGLLLPAPSYDLGLYDGSKCKPSTQEELCFSAKLNNRTSDQSNGTGTVKSILLRALSTHAGHSLAPAPEHPGATIDEFQLWANSLMAPIDTIDTLLDYSFAVPYSFEAGLHVNVLSLFNVPAPGMFSSKILTFKAIYSVLPPAMFYKDSPNGDGTHFTLNCNFDSSARAPEFLDGYRELFPTSIDEDTYLIVDVRTISIEKQKQNGGSLISVEPPGGQRSFWGLLPVSKDIMFGDLCHFVNNGVFQVPLIEGSVPKFVIESDKPLRTLISCLSSQKSDRNHLRLSGVSAIVMLQNPLLSDILRNQRPELRAPTLKSDTVDSTASLDQVDFASVAKNLELYLVDKLVAAVNSSPGENPISHEKILYDPRKFKGVKILAAQLAGLEDDHKKLKKSMNKVFAESVGLTNTPF